MKKIELVTGIKASVIGFGCAPIMGSIDAKSAKYAVDMAMEYGVNYFDIARSYGYGEAERFLGKIIRERKNEVYVATKFGIVPNWKAQLFNRMKPIVRYLNGLQKKTFDPSKVKPAKPSKFANQFLDRISPLRSINMIKSIEKSLSELKKDYVDFLFIHEPYHSLSYIDELLTTADSLKKEGKIRGFGLAAMHSQENLHKNYRSEFDLLQFNNPMVRGDYRDFVLEYGKKNNVIFSPFRGGLQSMSPNEKLNGLLNDFPNSVVVCSMFNPDHIKQNVEWANSINDKKNH